ncbi:MAG: hypothetical protein ACR2M1_01755 [Gemmatimonadaceae bacterium]
MKQRVRAYFNLLLRTAIGQSLCLPAETLSAYPVLEEARWREGGLPLRIGGWLLGQRTVAGITLRSTIFLADARRSSPRLLLHELGHVRQYQRDKAFPMRYLWESICHGYSRNRYEADADQFAERVLWSSTPRHPS